MNQYVCLICGYVHTGDEPPETCPVCDAPREDFELVEKYASGSTGVDSKNEDHTDIVVDDQIGRVVVLGSGIAALSTIEAIREQSDNVEIVMITNEEHLPYYRLSLTKYLAGEISEGDLCIHQQYWYDEKRIMIYKKRIVTDIDRATKQIECNDGLIVSYDKLIIALGSHPFIPPIKGVSQPGIHSLRSIKDANEIMEEAKDGKRVLVIGGGILGLEAAAALAKRGAKVTVGEGSTWLMPRQLTQSGAGYIVKALDAMKIDVEYAFRTTEIEKTDDGFTVKAKDGRTIEVDLVIVATGVRPNTYLARKAGLEVNNGIIVNDCLRTSDEDIYAVGDISEHYGVAYGLWTVAQFQGKIAAMNLLGLKSPFGGIPRSNTLKVMGVDLFSIGNIREDDASMEMLELIEKDRYLMFMVKDGLLIGSIVIGDNALTAMIKKTIESKRHFGQDQLVSVEGILELMRQ